MNITLWTEPWPVSVVVLTAWLVLYLGRTPFHKVVRAGNRLLQQPLKLCVRFLRASALDMRRRNQALLQAEARADAALRVEREWARLDEVVRRDIQGFPALQQALLSEIEQWDAEFKRSGEIPQLSPEWLKAAGAVARLRSAEDPMAERIQSGFKDLAERAQAETLRAHQKAVSARHQALARAQVMWGAVGQALVHMDNQLARVAESAFTIHEAMARYEILSHKEPHGDRTLVSSAFVRLLVTGFVLFAAAGGMVLNAHLLSGPLRAMGLGAGFEVGGAGTSSIAAGALIALEVVAGLLLFDVLNITHVFGFGASLSKAARRGLLASAITVLGALAALGAILALVRDTTPLGIPLLKGATLHSVSVWQTSAQILLALVLPVVMAFVAIPLEAFIYALRAVLGFVLEAFIQVLAFVLRVGARVMAALCDTLSAIYDVLILPPLLLERLLSYGVNASAVRRRNAADHR